MTITAEAERRIPSICVPYDKKRDRRQTEAISYPSKCKIRDSVLAVCFNNKRQLTINSKTARYHAVKRLSIQSGDDEEDETDDYCTLATRKTFIGFPDGMNEKTQPWSRFAIYDTSKMFSGLELGRRLLFDKLFRDSQHGRIMMMTPLGWWYLTATTNPTMAAKSL
jgi:hypothetical protein